MKQLSLERVTFGLLTRRLKGVLHIRNSRDRSETLTCSFVRLAQAVGGSPLLCRTSVAAFSLYMVVGERTRIGPTVAAVPSHHHQSVEQSVLLSAGADFAQRGRLLGCLKWWTTVHALLRGAIKTYHPRNKHYLWRCSRQTRRKTDRWANEIPPLLVIQINKGACSPKTMDDELSAPLNTSRSSLDEGNQTNVRGSPGTHKKPMGKEFRRLERK